MDLKHFILLVIEEKGFPEPCRPKRWKRQTCELGLLLIGAAHANGWMGPSKIDKSLCHFASIAPFARDDDDDDAN